VLLMCIKTVHSKKFINNYCATTKLKILYLQRSREKTKYFTSPKQLLKHLNKKRRN
jgi:hypothetical protein